MYTGLSTLVATQRLRVFGPNSVPMRNAPSLWSRTARELASPLIYVLLFALTFDVGLWIS